jgi:hypothetical protein
MEVLEQQKIQIAAPRTPIQLVKACSLDSGICEMPEIPNKALISTFNKVKNNSSYFIPASGTGSRMFQFLFDFFKNSDAESQTKVERFLNNINFLAFNRFIPDNIISDVKNGTMSLEAFSEYIVNEDGMGFGLLPKGLIPFHAYEYFALNPFQIHVLQAAHSAYNIGKIHFTINADFKEKIAQAIAQAKALSGYQMAISFSEQDSTTDSYVFDSSLNPIQLKDGSYLRRPSGHGALLSNLNALDARYIFIKNIDNIQHASQNEAQETFARLTFVLDDLNQQIEKILAPERQNWLEDLAKLNAKYQLFFSEEDFPRDKESLQTWANHPKRICGMVRNDGQPGGGPFWVIKNGRISKQIVEKVQISSDPQQVLKMVQSTHFNPVMMVLDTCDLSGKKVNLMDYCDDEAHMVVQKNQEGKQVQFIEKPGLWNGGMAHWISIFVEIPSSSFSPVKDVLDLLDAKHRQH